jgi:hypothetical protein
MLFSFKIEKEDYVAENRIFFLSKLHYPQKNKKL